MRSPLTETSAHAPAWADVSVKPMKRQLISHYISVQLISPNDDIVIMEVDIANIQASHEIGRAISKHLALGVGHKVISETKHIQHYIMS